MTLEELNKILWWIPSLKIRNFIRFLYNNHIELSKNISIIQKNQKMLERELDLIKTQNKILLLKSQMYKNNYYLYSNKIIVLQMRNGLVDQMQTYRTGYSISKNYNNIKVKYDLSWYETDGMDLIKKNKRNFEFLNIFNDLDFEIANDEETAIAKELYYLDERYGRDNKLIDYVIKNNPYIYINAQCLFAIDINRVNLTSIFNIDKYILPKLDDNNLCIYNDIIQNEYSVACHIRRTDYLYLKYRKYDLDEAYFIEAIEKLKSKLNNTSELKIYFFSDDIEWVKNKLISLIKDKYNYFVVDINNQKQDYIDFYLISKCKYQIASLGRFCKTAYEFNTFKNKILIVPDNKYLIK